MSNTLEVLKRLREKYQNEYNKCIFNIMYTGKDIELIKGIKLAIDIINEEIKEEQGVLRLIHELETIKIGDLVTGLRRSTNKMEEGVIVSIDDNEAKITPPNGDYFYTDLKTVKKVTPIEFNGLYQQHKEPEITSSNKITIINPTQDTAIYKINGLSITIKSGQSITIER